MKSTVMLICLAAGVAFLSLASSKSNEQDKDTTPSKPVASDVLIGEEPGQVRDDNGLKMKLAWCPPGEFTMGSPDWEEGSKTDEYQVDVTLTNGFWLGKYEVTQAEWKRVMKTEPWLGKGLTREGADFPATWVSWNDVTEFCRKFTEQERNAGRLSNGWEYTLPTEAQWERACRAQTDTKFSFGNDESNFSDYGWFSRDSFKASERYARRVGQKKANPWGLFDMHGNVWEWCRDIYTEELPGGRDPEVKNGGSFPVVRGGSWGVGASDCRSAFRYRLLPGIRNDDIGFRMALSSIR